MIDFENGVIVKIYKSLVDPISVWGRFCRPETKMGIFSGPSPERRSKVVKFAKNDRLDALIILARNEQCFPLENGP